jgi:hypothetical protein
MSATRFLTRTLCLLSFLLLTVNLGVLTCTAADDPEVGSLNKQERLDWFRDQGFGLFIHWSVDSQLGVVISHSLVGASPEYTDRFFGELPKTFDPDNFHPTDWARLAHLAGIRYVMFTTKHHSGFAMFETKTTPFGIMNTPFHRDITRKSSTPSAPRASPQVFTTRPMTSGGSIRTEKP